MQDFPLYGEQFKYLAVRPQVADYAQASDIIQKHLHEALLGKVPAPRRRWTPPPTR